MKNVPSCLLALDILPHRPASLAPTTELLPGASDQRPGRWEQSPPPLAVARGGPHAKTPLPAGAP